MTIDRPQRISPPAPIGSMLKDFSPAAVRASVKHEAERDAAYLEKIRMCPCLYCGQDPCCEAAHVRYASAAFGKASGLQKKPADRFAVPLCPEDHRIARHAQHQHNEEAWWASIGINPLLVAEQMWAKRDDLVAMRAVVMVAIANRTKEGK